MIMFYTIKPLLDDLWIFTFCTLIIIALWGASWKFWMSFSQTLRPNSHQLFELGLGLDPRDASRRLAISRTAVGRGAAPRESIESIHCRSVSSVSNNLWPLARVSAQFVWPFGQRRREVWHIKTACCFANWPDFCFSIAFIANKILPSCSIGFRELWERIGGIVGGLKKEGCGRMMHFALGAPLGGVRHSVVDYVSHWFIDSIIYENVFILGWYWINRFRREIQYYAICIQLLCYYIKYLSVLYDSLYRSQIIYNLFIKLILSIQLVILQWICK